MKKYKTDSYFTYICENSRKKFIRKYKRKGVHAYPRTIPLRIIDKCLKNAEILHPKILKNGIGYIDEEFIESSIDMSSLSREKITNTIINYITQMNRINIETLKKYIKWNNNTEFLTYQIENLKEVLVKRSYPKINKRIGELDKLKKQLDDNRKLTFLHGDIHLKNMIANEKGIYLIDWELATYGDLAYELAICFILMELSEIEKENFISILSKVNSYEADKLKDDIEIYIKFELLRRNIMQDIRKKR